MVHPTALIDPSSTIGPNTRIGPYSLVEEGVQTGQGCMLAAHVILRRGTILGENVRVDSFAVVGGDPQDLRFDPVTPSGVRVGDGAVLREGVTIHRSTREGGATTVGAGALLMGYCHVGHDCRVGARVVMGNGALLAGHVEVGEGSFLSGGAVFHQFTRIGEGAMAGGNARLGLDLPPFTLACERNELHGLNLVGLRRRGCDDATISELKRLYREIYQGGSPQKNANALQAKTELGKIFLAFFVPSKRGYLRPERHLLASAE